MGQGFVYQRVPHITLKSIANNAEIDVIYEKFRQRLEPLREKLNNSLGAAPHGYAGLSENLPWEDWQIPREADDNWPDEARDTHARWWEQRIARQKEINASIAARGDAEPLYDKPYEDSGKVRVAGPFTVESLSPHRVLGVDENDELIDPLKHLTSRDREGATAGEVDPFLNMVLENLRSAGVQQSHKEDKIEFTSITPHPGEYIAAQGRYEETSRDREGAQSSTSRDREGVQSSTSRDREGVQSSTSRDREGAQSSTSRDREGALPDGRGSSEAREKRAGIFIGPEFGTVCRQDVVGAAREAAEMGFDVLIVCAFNYDAHASELGKLGGLPILKARMNADLHMADELKNTGKGNLFVIFGEPDIDLLPPEDAPQPKQPASGEQPDLREYQRMRVRVNGVDVFHPSTGQVRSDDAEAIACWFIDTDYNEESFFVRQAYFLGANDPYKSLKTTLKAEIDHEAWQTLHSDVSREFAKPQGGRIAVKVINHLGDEVMKVFRVG